MALHGRKWSQVAKLVPGRTDVQCRERYMNVLNPGVLLARSTVAGRAGAGRLEGHKQHLAASFSSFHSAPAPPRPVPQMSSAGCRGRSTRMRCCWSLSSSTRRWAQGRAGRHVWGIAFCCLLGGRASGGRRLAISQKHVAHALTPRHAVGYPLPPAAAKWARQVGRRGGAPARPH